VDNVLEKGRTFGELSILYKMRRTADVVCKHDCIIAKVTKEKYIQIMGDEGERIFLFESEQDDENRSTSISVPLRETRVESKHDYI
jgi:CRP-like cAMP-binding protein